MYKKIMPFLRTFLTIKTLFVFVLILTLSTSGVLFWKYQQAQSELKKVVEKQQEAEKKNKEISDAVSSIYEVPTDEQPTIATVVDKEKLKDQAFFAKAENGDQAVMYPKAKLAILYRPLTKKIVQVTTLNIDTSEAQSAPSSVSLALYNGTNISGLTNKASAKIKTEFQQLNPTVKQNASRIDYTQTQVIDVSGKNNQLVQQLATTFKGVVTTLPTGEQKPNTEILIILASY